MTKSTRKTKKKTNDKSVDNHSWDPYLTQLQTPYFYGYHKSFPVPTATTNAHYVIIIQKDAKIQNLHIYLTLKIH